MLDKNNLNILYLIFLIQFSEQKIGNSFAYSIDLSSDPHPDITFCMVAGFIMVDASHAKCLKRGSKTCLNDTGKQREKKEMRSESITGNQD